MGSTPKESFDVNVRRLLIVIIIINIPTLGYYYLVSPNKEIVYETGDLGDYEEILKIIRN